MTTKPFKTAILCVLLSAISSLSAFSQSDTAKTDSTPGTRITQKKRSASSKNLRFTIQSHRGVSVSEGLLDEELKLILVEGELDNKWNKVFLGNVMIDTLRPNGELENNYLFVLRSKNSEKDFLKLFNIFNEDRVALKLSIGKNLKDRVEIGEFSVIIDPHRKLKLTFALIAIALIVALLVYGIVKNGLVFLRDQSILKDKAPFSLSRTQLAFWTLIILFAFFYVWVVTGEGLDITGDVLALLGISAATSLVGNIMDQNDIKANVDRHQNVNGGNFFINIISDSKGVSIHRLQNVVFTIAIASFFLYSVYLEKKIPELDDQLMILMGISSGTYLSIKSGENKPGVNTQQQNTNQTAKN